MDDLAEDERVIAAATAGPWVLNHIRFTTAYEIFAGKRVITASGWGMTKSDGAFIARARTRYPALVKEVREVRVINDAQREALLEFERVLRTDAACVTGWDQFQRAITLMGKALKLYRVRPKEAP